MTPVAARAILEQLPERNKIALMNRPAEMEYLVETVIEMATEEYL
jgi:hypothetical protein